MPHEPQERKNLLERRNTAWIEGRASVARGTPILIADDSEADIFFLLRAFAASGVRNPIFLVRSGAETQAFLAGTGPFSDRSRFPLPKIVFLDLRLPSPDGFEILNWKQKRPELEHVLFIAMSNFDRVSAINEAYDAGANTFLSKPINPLDIQGIIDAYEDYWTLASEKTASSGL